MRPGQSCPGVALALGRQRTGLPPASMRPGQSCPGVVAAVEDLYARILAGFNEAGAIMPRSGWCTIPKVL